MHRFFYGLATVCLFKAKIDTEIQKGRREGGKASCISQGASAPVWCYLREEVAKTLEEFVNGLVPSWVLLRTNVN